MNETEKYLNEFIEEMRLVLNRHQASKGDSWIYTSEDELRSCLFQEIREFSIKNDPQLELIDIANSCFLLWAKQKFFKNI